MKTNFTVSGSILAVEHILASTETNQSGETYKVEEHSIVYVMNVLNPRENIVIKDFNKFDYKAGVNLDNLKVRIGAYKGYLTIKAV